MISGHRGTRGLYVTVISRFARRSTFLVALAALLVASGPALLPGAVTNAQHESIVIIDALGDSGIAGDATLIDNGDGTTTVDILLSGTSSSHSVSIHTGDCDQWGDASYPLADLDADGGSVSHVDVSLDALLAQAPLAVVVQQSMDETGPAVACGEIVGDSDGADPLAESGGSGEERLFAATGYADFENWQADFWFHNDDTLSTESNSQTYILAPYEIGPRSIYVLEADIRLGGSFSEYEPPCHSYFGFMLGLRDPQGGIFAGVSDIGDPAQHCAGEIATWTPWFGIAQPVTTIDRTVPAPSIDEEWHTYRLEIEGDQLRLLVDGVEHFRSSDERYAQTGSVGIVSGNLALEVRQFVILGPAMSAIATPAPEPLASPVASPAVLIGEPVDIPETTWISYENDLLGVTLRFPADWVVLESDDRLLVSFLPPDSDPGVPSPRISLYFAPDVPYDGDSVPPAVTPLGPITVAGVTGRAYEDAANAIPLQWTYVELPLSTGTLYLASTIGPSVDLRPVFEALLATIEFPGEH